MVVWDDMGKGKGAYGKKLCPRCITGRWGTSVATEAHVLGPPKDDFMDVVATVLEGIDNTGRVTEKAEAKKEAAPLPGTRDIHMASTEQYKATHGKWRQTVSDNIRSEVVYFTKALVHGPMGAAAAYCWRCSDRVLTTKGKAIQGPVNVVAPGASRIVLLL